LENTQDKHTRSIYKKEAEAISEIQKGILAISRAEQPFDVFICYKETSDSGVRTRDSTIAQDIYYKLTEAGYRVFFARITLEDKLGAAYEPYIFSALNSAKVMLVIGTNQEYFNAVWVRNEWSRYLALMKKDRNRLLIPCYQDMDPYDLPEDLSFLQSQDMSKIGFLQDIIRGIKKVLDAGKPSPAPAPAATVVAAPAAPGIESLHKRMLLFLEGSDWKQADEYADRILDIDPEYAPAYVGKLCAELEIQSEQLLAQIIESYDENKNYKNAIRFADDELRERLAAYNNKVQETRLGIVAEENAIRDTYEAALKRGESANKIVELSAIIEIFRELGEFQDSSLQVERFEKLKAKKERRKANLIIFSIGVAYLVFCYIIGSIIGLIG
jgi:hypothetical protein